MVDQLTSIAISILFALNGFCLLQSAQAQLRYQHNVRVKFFTDVSLICDEVHLNLTETDGIRSMSWILPDGQVVHANSVVNPKKHQLSEPADPTKADITKLAAYNLTVLRVSSEQFGYYTCVVEYEYAGRSIDTIRWGLNVDGADFSDFIEEYKHNALVGGVTAAVVFILIGSLCLFSHFRFNNRQNEDLHGGGSRIEQYEETEEFSKHARSNKAFQNDSQMSETDLTQEKSPSEPGKTNL